MRPPASDIQPVGAMPAHDVSSGLLLNGLSDWRNLTNDNSIQILQLEDHMNDGSFYHNTGHLNSLKFIQTIFSPSRDSTVYGETEDIVQVAQQINDAYMTRTLVNLDFLATRSGTHLDTRLIFSPSNKTKDSRRNQDNDVNTPNRNLTSKSGDCLVQKRGNESSPVCQTRKLWHSDSELFVHMEEPNFMETKSCSYISNRQHFSPDTSPTASPCNVSLIQPLQTITHKSKVGEIKTVPLLTAGNNRMSEVKNAADLSQDGLKTIPLDVVRRQTDDSHGVHNSVKLHNTVSKVYSKITRSLRKKRKRISHIGKINDLFRGKDVKGEVNICAELPNNSEESVSGISYTRKSSKELKFFSADFHREKDGEESFLAENGTSELQSYLPHLYESERIENGQRRNVKTGSVCRQKLVLGVRSRKSVSIDESDMDLVWVLKRQFGNTDKKLQIKTNGSLKSKVNTCCVDKMRFSSPKRGNCSSRLINRTLQRQNSTCLISTV